MLLALKDIHILCAYATGAGMVIRGVLILAQNPLGRHRIAKILPHMIDTMLLLSGVAMAYQLSYLPPEQPWLFAKLVALGMYIFFGLVLIRWAKTRQMQLLGLFVAMLTFVYILGAAHSKSVWSVLFYG